MARVINFHIFAFLFLNFCLGLCASTHHQRLVRMARTCRTFVLRTRTLKSTSTKYEVSKFGGTSTTYEGLVRHMISYFDFFENNIFIDNMRPRKVAIYYLYYNFWCTIISLRNICTIFSYFVPFFQFIPYKHKIASTFSRIGWLAKIDDSDVLSSETEKDLFPGLKNLVNLLNENKKVC